MTGTPNRKCSSVLWFIAVFSSLGVVVNVYLAAFNMLPIHPLDGSHVLDHFLPRDLQRRYEEIMEYGPFILLALLILFRGLLGTVLLVIAWPFVRVFAGAGPIEVWACFDRLLNAL